MNTVDSLRMFHRDPSSSKLRKHGSPHRSAPGRDAAQRTLLIAGAAILGTIGCYRRLLFGGSLCGYDWSIHWHYYDWIRTSLTQFGTLPLYMKDALYSPNFLANPESPVLGPFVWLLYFLPTDVYIRTLIVLYAAAGLTGLVALLLDLGVEWPIAAVLAVIFGFNGFFVSHLAVGHHWSLGSFLLPPILFLYRRAALGRWVYLWCAVALNICLIFEGYHHPFIWNNVFLALYGTAWAVQTRSVAPLKTLMCFFAASAGFGAVKLLPMYAEFASYFKPWELPGFSPAWILWSLLGIKRNAFTIPASDFYWEYNFYIGSMACLLLLVGIPAGVRRAWPWLAVGAFFLLISLDLSTWQSIPEPWSMIRHWPVWRSQRCPSRFVIVALTAFLISAGIGLQTVWERTRIRLTHPRVLLALAVVTMVGASTDLDSAARAWLPLALGAPLPEHDHFFNAAFAVPPGTATLLASAPNREVFEVDMPIGASAPDLLWLPSPHWHLQRHTDLSPGKEEVVVVYTPPYLYLGAVVSLTSCIAVLASAVWKKQRLRR